VTDSGASAPVPPVPLSIDPVTGRLHGSNGRYEKFLADLAGLYRDDGAYRARLAADDGAAVYWVESSATEAGPGGLITGVSVLEPGRVGAEYAMTRGHLHALADRSELYLGLSGTGVMILETLDGRSEVVDVTPGSAVYVPGHWVHRSVNVGPDRFSTLFCYPADAGQDYAIIERAGGMASLVVVDGDGYAVVRNPDHRGYRTEPGP
jgi:glucose-6-phosphate isomerase, archaeal